jgi:hypothetical protein
MGMFKIKVKVSNSKDSSLFFEEEFWVDRGGVIFIYSTGIFRTDWC